MKEAMITIPFNEYERLKDIEFQMNFLVGKVNIKEELHFDPLIPLITGNSAVKIKKGEILKKDLDFFYKNLLDIENLYIIEDEKRKW